MDLQVLGPITVVIGTIISAWFVYKSNKAANLLTGQDQLNRHLQEDNRIQRELTQQCQKECQDLRNEYTSKIAELEAKILDLQMKSYQDKTEISRLKAKLEERK